MSRRRKPDELLNRFSDRYSAPSVRAGELVERSVIGGNVGANGYLTVKQADQLVDALALDRTKRLLDVGSGRGWPGIYLSERSGCRSVLMDVPPSAIQAASRRARRKRLHGRVHALLASATNLPFRDDTFEAITHSDML